MKIIMLVSEMGSIDGIRTSRYVAGTEYDLTSTDGERDLAAAFVGAGMAEVVEHQAEPLVDIEQGMEPVAPEPNPITAARAPRGKKK